MSGRVLGTLVARRNRFAAEVTVERRQAVAHVPNSGRMLELMAPGAHVALCRSPSPRRKTAYDLLAVRHGGQWVGIDARMPPAMVIEAWRCGLLPGFDMYDTVRREVAFGGSRLDLRFEGPAGVAYVEAKSVNLVEDGVALFPDAPTTRGTRHLLELVAAVRQGLGAAVCFVIQRDDACVFRPHRAADPAFADALRLAVASGVRAYAIACATGFEGTRLTRVIPVELA